MVVACDDDELRLGGPRRRLDDGGAGSTEVNFLVMGWGVCVW